MGVSLDCRLLELEVQVRAEGVAGVADLPDELAGAHGVTLLGDPLAEVAVPGDRAVPVLDLELVAEAGVVERPDDGALGHRVDRGAGGGAEVHAVVRRAPAGPEAGGDVPGVDRSHPAPGLTLGLGPGSGRLGLGGGLALGGAGSAGRLLVATLQGGGLDGCGVAPLGEVGGHRLVGDLLGAGHGALGRVELEGRRLLRRGVHDARSGCRHHERRGRRGGQHEARGERSG